MVSYTAASLHLSSKLHPRHQLPLGAGCERRYRYLHQVLAIEQAALHWVCRAASHFQRSEPLLPSPIPIEQATSIAAASSGSLSTLAASRILAHSTFPLLPNLTKFWWAKSGAGRGDTWHRAEATPTCKACCVRWAVAPIWLRGELETTPAAHPHPSARYDHPSPSIETLLRALAWGRRADLSIHPHCSAMSLAGPSSPAFPFEAAFARFARTSLHSALLRTFCALHLDNIDNDAPLLLQTSDEDSSSNTTICSKPCYQPALSVPLSRLDPLVRRLISAIYITTQFDLDGHRLPTSSGMLLSASCSLQYHSWNYDWVCHSVRSCHAHSIYVEDHKAQGALCAATGVLGRHGRRQAAPHPWGSFRPG